MWRGGGEGIVTSSHIPNLIRRLSNAALHSQTHLQYRVSLRNELLMLGMAEIINGLKQIDNKALQEHIELFEMVCFRKYL